MLTHVNPVRMLSNDDFPAPEGPIIAVSSPDLKQPDTLLRICLSSGNKLKLHFCKL